MIDNRSTDKRFGRCYLTILKSALLSKINSFNEVYVIKYLYAFMFYIECLFFLTYVYYIFNYLDRNNQVLYL